MTREHALHAHNLVNREDETTYALAANYVLSLGGIPQQELTPKLALEHLTTLFHLLLQEGKYVEAALLCWGNKLFNPRPRSVRMIWRVMDERNKILCIGSSAQGKTYSACVKVMLRWCEDPKYTTVKLISTTGGHSKSNIYSTFVRLHTESIIPLPGLVRENFIGLDTNDLHSSIAKIAIQKGESGTASLRGFHPLPRPTPHPKFGDMSFSIAILDEAEDIPWGVWKGVDNIASTENVQVYAATNPRNINSEFGTRAEPVGGWGEFNREEDEEWEGRQGWHVVRLDAARSENVVERRLVYSGFMDYPGFLNYEEKGLSDPDYDIFARGRWPLMTAQYNVVPSPFLNGVKQVYNFVGTPENVASLDPAFAEGGDEAIFTTGRYGLANGVTEAGRIIERFQKPKEVLQVEQQFAIEKGFTQDIAANVIEICRSLHVRPEWFALDSTGNATGLRDLLLRQFGPILPLMWGAEATNKKILDEDTQPANELYYGLVSEMWFAFARWLEFGFVKIAPMMQTQQLFSEATARKYISVSKTMRKVESKIEFKKNNGGKSCDRSDSVIMLLHLCRMRGQDRPAMLPPEPKRPRRSEWDVFREREPASSAKLYDWVKLDK